MLTIISCSKQVDERAVSIQLKTGFKRITPDSSGVHFQNTVEDNASLNYLTYEGFYQGAGVGIGDFNNDGLPDIFFGGNTVSDKLYLNKGNFQFDDVTQEAGILNDSTWSTGIAVVDINNDGWDDIYVCKFLYDSEDQRRNLLYLNKGDGTFLEAAEQFGLDSKDYSIQANFFDFDKDGDLDMYLVNQPPTKNSIRYQLGSFEDYRYTDRLFRNDGDYGFKDVTESSGLKNFGYGLNAIVSDLNDDGWMDIYVSNDFEEADFFYINNGNGTFTNEISKRLGHITTYSMGGDAADFDNDGKMDFMVADMVAESPFREKTNMASMNPQKFKRLSARYGLPQYMFNALHRNNGNGTFSNYAHLASVAKTDWSWSVLFADFDNDMDKDIYVTSGIQRDVAFKDIKNKFRKLHEEYNNLDYKKQREIGSKELYVLNQMPSTKLENPIFLNEKDWTFLKSNDKLELTDKTWSHGAAYADLDLDGDLDLVTNNSDQKASIYKNKSNGNFIAFRLSSANFRRCPIGAKIKVFAGSVQQTQEVNPVRGYQSTCDCNIHFGMGQWTKADSMQIIWPDNSFRTIKNLPGNKFYSFRKSGKTIKYQYQESSDQIRVIDQIEYESRDFDDYQNQTLLPYKISAIGPRIAFNPNDQLLFVPGDCDFTSKIYHVINNSIQLIQELDRIENCDIAGEFFDFDGDNDLDLYVAAGGNEYPESSLNYQDRIYINNKGKFTFFKGYLDERRASNYAIHSLDYNKDGFEDIIVGCRNVPQKYGESDQSILVSGGALIKVDTIPFDLGMVTSIVSIENDKNSDVFVSEEWGDIHRLILDSSGIFKKVDLNTPKGLYQSLFATDFDNDGDDDVLVGNFGRNTRLQADKEARLFLNYGNFDGKDPYDLYISYDYERRNIPLRGFQCSSQQLPDLKNRIESYEEFALLSVDEILNDTEVRKTKFVDELGHMVLMNDKGFNIEHLPGKLNSTLISSFGKVDSGIIAVGGLHDIEVETSRLDQSSVFKINQNKVSDILAPLSLRSDIRSLQMIGKDLALIGSRGHIYLVKIK